MTRKYTVFLLLTDRIYKGAMDEVLKLSVCGVLQVVDNEGI